MVHKVVAGALVLADSSLVMGDWCLGMASELRLALCTSSIPLVSNSCRLRQLDIVSCRRFWLLPLLVYCTVLRADASALSLSVSLVSYFEHSSMDQIHSVMQCSTGPMRR